MSQNDIETLRRLTTTYGTAEVVRELTNITNTACAEEYANNPDAIIHKYAPVLSRAFTELSMARLQRFKQGADFVQSMQAPHVVEQMRDDRG